MRAYNHAAIEAKWQKAWAKASIYKTPDKAKSKDNFFLLVEFPYPSGNLHVGHWYAFAVPDMLARMMRMQGKNVLYPIGFDAFGLPAENAAIKNRLNPRKWTLGNIEYMKKQIASMGTSFDWSREVVTCDPAYYKWTQWLFLQLFKKGLVHRKQTAANWCPKCKTVLANEQVVNGKCERCGTEVEQRQMLQWNISITEYADRLVDDLKELDWPEQIKESQRNWIGRSEGAEIDFPLDVGKKYKFVILHGFEGSPDMPRWQWVKRELESLGHEVVLPRLPHTGNPLEAEQVAAALAATTYDENTVLVGHSLGAVVALKVLEKLKTPVARLVTIGGFVDPEFKDRNKKDRMFEETWTWTFDADTIHRNTKSMTLLHDPVDYGVSDDQAARLSKVLNVPITLGVSTKPHFTGETEPGVLMWLRPTIRVFTTCPDTLYGATYLVLAPEHPWVKQALTHKGLLKNEEEVLRYIEVAGKKSELERMADQKEKTGVQLKGVEALNPATKERIPVFIADYVLPHYGTGAIMAVPAHDDRDGEFAKKFELPIRQVVRPVFKPENKRADATFRETVSAFVRNDKGEVLFLKWKEYDWLTGVVGGIEKGETPEQTAVREVFEETGYRAKALFVSPIAVESHYFAEHKNEWRSRLDHPVLLELENNERGVVSPEELAKHESRWIKIEEALNMEMFKNNKIALELSLGKLASYSDKRYGESQILVSSGPYNGLSPEEAKVKMTEAFGRKKTTYKLRDWIVSRQRYWGVPIPVIHCEKCGPVPVPDKDLPVKLPEVTDYLPEGSGKSPLAKVKKWVSVKCPKCKGKAERETDTLDTFVDSSWYFLRYTNPKNKKKFADMKKMDAWMPIDLYSGGAEHTTMHLLYSRFWQKALYDMKLVKDKEPYRRRMNRSIILGPDGQKMSKSKGNVIDPDEVVKRLGTDTVRMYLAFIGPYNEVANYPWNPDGVVGVRRFLERVWRVQDIVAKDAHKELDTILNKTIKKVTEDIPAQKFNTAISQLMILINAIEKAGSLGVGQWRMLLTLLAPFAPHMAEELWHMSGKKKSVHLERWPSYDASLLTGESVAIAIQINGKTRGEVQIQSGASKDAQEQAARAAVAGRLEGKTVTRTIVVPGRLVNFVVEE